MNTFSAMISNNVMIYVPLVQTINNLFLRVSLGYCSNEEYYCLETNLLNCKFCDESATVCL